MFEIKFFMVQIRRIIKNFHLVAFMKLSNILKFLNEAHATVPSFVISSFSSFSNSRNQAKILK